MTTRSLSRPDTWFVELASDDERDHLPGVLVALDSATFLELCDALRADLRARLIRAAEPSLRPTNRKHPSCRAVGMGATGRVRCARPWRHGGLHAWWDYDTLAAVWNDARCLDRLDGRSGAEFMRKRARALRLSRRIIDRLFAQRRLTSRDPRWRWDVLLSDLEAEAAMAGIRTTEPAYRERRTVRGGGPVRPVPVVGGHPSPLHVAGPDSYVASIRVERCATAKPHVVAPMAF